MMEYEKNMKPQKEFEKDMDEIDESNDERMMETIKAFSAKKVLY
jgi:hypothetical protein